MKAGWCARTIRAAMFAAVCVLLAALGHVLMSGSHVPWWTLAAGLGMTGTVGWALAGRERGLPLVVSVAVAAQAVLHSAFSLGQSADTATGSMRHDMGAMDMGSMDMGSLGSLVHLGHSMGGSSSSGMLAAHLLAALLSGLWLAYGERAVFRILRAVAGWLAAPLRLLLALPVPAHRPRPRVRCRRAARAPRLLLLVHSIISRGPPAGAAVA
ncbi:hypothetical protein ACFSL4_34120 [Streptomyces caeni]|uniref:Integral membrane protein n=1 Tax=Streptomyces caeni TaxID=2307231 RepID=A0ABW4J0C1_9ACTN